MENIRILASNPARARSSTVHALLAHKWKIGGGLLLIALVSWLLLRWYVGPEVVVYPVVRADLVKSVVASGHVETPYRVEIASQITATVEDVLVAEGESVKRGQPLIALDARELRAAVAQATGEVAQADARLRQIRELTRPAADEALKQAQATLTNAQASFDRAEQLARSGYGTRATLDDAIKAVDVARAQVRAAALQVYTTSPAGSDYVMAQTQLAQSQANLATATARLGYATIVSPREGTLISRSVERGTVVAPGKALMVLAPAGAVQLVVQIDEKNLGLLHESQDALASAEAYPDRKFPATLTYINPSVDISRASVEVKLTVPDAPKYLRQDMTVSVDVQVEKRAGTVVVPARMIHEPNGASPYVLVLREGRPRAQPVRLGLRAGDQVEVLEGLSPGDRVIPVLAGVKAGQRIRPIQS